MNINLDYLNIDIPTSWNNDQSSWTSSINQNLKNTKYINEWLYKIRTKNMSSQSLNHGNNQINMLKLQLKQIDNQIQQLQLHLTTLNQLEETDQISSNIANIEDSIQDLIQEKQNIEREIQDSLEISNIFQNRLAFPECSNEDKEMKWKILYNAIPQKSMVLTEKNLQVHGKS